MFQVSLTNPHLKLFFTATLYYPENHIPQATQHAMTETFKDIVFYKNSRTGVADELNGKSLSYAGVPSSTFDPATHGQLASSEYTLSTILDAPDVGELTAMSLGMGTPESIEQFLAAAPKLSKLDSLFLFNETARGGARFNLTALCEAFPLLSNIGVFQLLNVTPMRNTTLKQICSSMYDCTELLQVCSLPNLEALETTIGNSDFVDTFNQINFAKLRHFGLCFADAESQLDVLKQLDMPKSICSLLFGEDVKAAHLLTLSTLPFAHQLTHLTIMSFGFNDARCLSPKRFPNLKFLKWQGDMAWRHEEYPYEETPVELPDFFFDESLSHLKALDLCSLAIDDAVAERLLESPLMHSLDNLYLDYNMIFSPRIVTAFEQLPCTMSLRHQSV